MTAGLALPGVDAVVIASPHADHYDQVWQALEAGKHVLCEKPLAIDADQARALAISADRRKPRLAVGHNHRFYPPIVDLLRHIEEGAIGAVTSVRAEIGHWASPEFLNSWHGKIEKSGGGTLMDNGPHACDLIRLLLGEVVATTGYLRHEPSWSSQADIEAFALFRGFDGAIAELRSSWRLAAGYFTLEARGQKGWIKAETAPWKLTVGLLNERVITKHYLRERLAHKLHQKTRGCDGSLVVELESFAACCRSRKPDHVFPHANGWDGCRSVEMIASAYQAALLAKEVELKPLPVQPPTESRLRSIVKEPVSHA